MANHAHVIHPNGASPRRGPSEGVIDGDYVDITDTAEQTSPDRSRIGTTDSTKSD